MYDSGPQDLVTTFLCIHIAVNKMQLCSLSIAYACPYHNPTTTIGHSVHNIHIRRPLAHMMPYKWSAVVRPVARIAKFSKTTLVAAYGREINIKFSGNSSGGHSCSQHANCTLPQLATTVALCLCNKTSHFRVAFNVPGTRLSCCLVIFLIYHTCQVDELSCQRRNAH
jgi:hypothetical protein